MTAKEAAEAAEAVEAEAIKTHQSSRNERNLNMDRTHFINPPSCVRVFRMTHEWNADYRAQVDANLSELRGYHPK